MLATYRSLFRFILLAFLFSCQNKKNAPAENTDPVKSDSNTLIKSESSANPYASVDVSPMDMSYFPVDYPKLKMANNTSAPPVVRVIYSRPHLQGRKLFQDLLKYNEPWRLGANEATEIQFYRDATIQNKKISAGRYILYCIPQENKWTIVLNSNIDTWGLKIDSTKDLLHFEIPVTTNNPSLEYFTMIFEKSTTGADLVMAWDNIVARLPINFDSLNK